jgi:hypothetical protein
VADSPNPDLEIEAAISPARVGRPGIKAALRAAGVWRFDDKQIVIKRPDEHGTCQTVARLQESSVRVIWAPDGRPPGSRCGPSGIRV